MVTKTFLAKSNLGLVLLMALLFCSHALAAGGSLSKSDYKKLTRNFEQLETQWVQAAVDESNSILRNPEYTAETWTAFFSDYFANHPLTNSLRVYLMYPMFGWFDEHTHQRLQAGFYPVLTKMITETTLAHPKDLGRAMARDTKLLQTCFNTHLFVNACLISGETIPPATIFEFYRKFILDYPSYFNANTVLTKAQSGIGALRIQVWGILRMAASPEQFNEVAATVGLTSSRLALWNEQRILLCDNGGFNDRQMEVTLDFFSKIPAALPRPLVIESLDAAGEIPAPAEIWIEGFNISSGWRAGARHENHFPSDARPHLSDMFMGALSHEYNHTVHARYIEADPVLSARHKALLASSGKDRMNYLRSMIDDGAFINAPHEFFASIANAWFSDSAAVITLGVTRFKHGRKDPINQALFFAEVYSCGGDTTCLYKSDVRSNLILTHARIGRDEQGRLNAIQFDKTWHRFSLDANGDVTAIQSDEN